MKSDSDAGAADVSVIRELVRALDHAIVDRDAAGLDRILSDDFVGTTPTGDAFVKADYIAFHCHSHAGPHEVDSGPPDAARIRIHGDCAVVDRRVQVRKPGPGGSLEQFSVQRMEVAFRTQGGWRLISGQGTRVAAGPRAP